MNLQVSAQRTLLFFVSCFLLLLYDLRTSEAALSACSRTHPGYVKCREINADCLDAGNRNYKCQCSTGYWMFRGRCQKSDWCADGEIGDLLCKSNGTVCKSLAWTTESYTNLPFKCECQSKYVQSGVCSVNKLYCEQRGAKAYKYENITLCKCDNDQFFDYSISKCQNLDLCPFKKCEGKYEECQGSECVCKTSYRREGNACTPRKYCDSTVCANARCEEGPEDDPKSVRCYCDSGYVLTRKGGVPYCQLVRCESHSLNPCDHRCVYSADKESSYCTCLSGHNLKPDNITCELEASHKCSYNVCNSRSICTKIGGEETCQCKNSLVGEGTCLDRCAANKLLPNTCPDRCKSIEGGFQCICEGKYKLSKNQVTCEERRMCLEGEEGLRNCSEKNRTCVESPETKEGFTCGGCLHGLQEYQGDCVDLCQLQRNILFCEERRGTCVSVNALTNKVECKCRPLFAWNNTVGCVFAHHSYTGMLRIFNSYEEIPQNHLTDTLWYGDGDVDWKKLDHDVSKSLLTLFGQALSGMNVLHCRHDQIGEDHDVCIVCMIELQLHFPDYGILQKLNSHTVCRGRDDTHKMFCFIPPYLKLVPRQRDIQNVEDPFHASKACEIPYGSSVCSSSTDCVPEGNGFSCRCKKGFVVKSTTFLNNDKTGIMEMCQDINECETRNPCPSGTTCINKIGDFECLCERGLYRKNTTGNSKLDTCTRACDQFNCTHGKCEDHSSGFYCRCDPGYSGLYCEELITDTDKTSADSSSRTGYITVIAVGCVEAAVFLAFLIFYVVYRRKLAKPAKDTPRTKATIRIGTPQSISTRNQTTNHIPLRSTAVENNTGFRQPYLEEEPEEPIYADCTQIT